MEGSEDKPRLIYYPITLTLMTRRCSSIKHALPGMLRTNPLLNDILLQFCFSYLFILFLLYLPQLKEHFAMESDMLYQLAEIFS